MNQGYGIGVAHDGAVEVDHGQGETGALQERAQLADIDHRRHARGARRPVTSSSASSQDWRKLHQGIGRRTGRRCSRPSGFKGAAELDQRAGHVVDELQVENIEDRVDSAGFESQGLAKPWARSISKLLTLS